MTIDRALVFSILMSAISAGCAGPALAQACTRQGIDVSCDDGRRGILSGDAIIWTDGTRSSLTSPHPSVIIGNKSSVVVGPGRVRRQGQGRGADGQSERAEQGALRRSRWRIVLLLVRLGAFYRRRPRNTR